MRRRLTRVTIATFTVRAAAILINFFVNVGMARLLGVEGYGVFAVVLAWSLVLSVPAGLGFDRLVMRELARMEVRPDPPRARSMLRTAIITTAISSGMAGALVLVAAFVAGDGDATGSLGAIALGALVVPLLTLTALHQGAITGLHRVGRGHLPDAIVRPAGLLVLIVAGLAWFRERPPVATGTMLLVLAAAAGLASAVLLWRGVAGSIARPTAEDRALDRASREGTSAGGWIRAASPLAFLASAAVISAQADIVLVGILLDPASAGIYAIAVRVSVLVSFPLTVLNAALAPTYAMLIAANDLARLQRIVTIVSRLVTAVTVVAAIGFVLYGRPILALFGSEFGAGATALAILVAGQAINAVFGPTSTLMLMGGFERRAALDMAVGATTEIVLVVLLARLFGLEGAAIGSAVGIVTWNVLMAIHLRRRLDIRTTAFGL